MALNTPYSLVIGASGALFAVEGTLVVLKPNIPVTFLLIPVAIPLWSSVIIAFLLTFMASGNIAWEAHLGGLAFGLLAGLFFRYRETGRIF
jgi:membrane associated rhomboid family serine protease